eukprot:TRINITY_DN3554_c0_g1_i1.p1 TRINITY_DN3554_c0_g1~~TRINITY_DN3554_c0_g1_i1.p1  ORF type:complete len:510 (-),score=98.68 TRINITY_DN3554_c0_g1_i1:68-1597(-)
MENKCKPIVIVGAGISGLYCAEILQSAGLPVLVLEAAPFIGGRVKSAKFVDWGWKLVDVGADFIHGQKTILKKYTDRRGFPYRKLFTWAQGDGPAQAHHVGGGAAMYYLGLKKKLVRWDTDDKDVTTVNKLLWSMGKNELDYSDTRSLENYLRENGVSEEGLGLADAGYANTMCSSLDRLPVYGVVHLEHAWDRDGGGDYRLDYSFAEVINHMARNLTIRTNFPVAGIEYSGSANQPIIVRGSNGESIEASKVVCAVPLNVLKSGAIKFSPELPAERKLALDTFKMYSSIKVCIEFSERFWPKETHGMICSHSFIPEFWFEDPDRPVGGLTPESAINLDSNGNPVPSKKRTYLATGFACSKFAEYIGTLKKDEVIKRTLAQLDEMFGNISVENFLLDHRPGAKSTPRPEKINPPNPATRAYLDSMVIDWGKNPLIGGGYSSPSFGETDEMRKMWSYPLNSKLYFAGEAFNKDSIMTLHGGMETSIVAANSILKSFGIPTVNPMKKHSKL